jgi:hypothetical protein
MSVKGVNDFSDVSQRRPYGDSMASGRLGLRRKPTAATMFQHFEVKKSLGSEPSSPRGRGFWPDRWLRHRDFQCLLGRAIDAVRQAEPMLSDHARRTWVSTLH